MHLPFRLKFIISILLSLAIGIGGGYSLWGMHSPESAQTLLKEVINQDTGKPETVDFSLFWQVWNRLHETYVDKDTLDTDALVTGAIEGMVAAVGDPHTTYLEPVSNQKFQENISGSFSGVGMEIGLRDNRISVVAPLKDTPAYRAGLKAGDFIVTIDDVSTDGMTVEEAVTLIRGKRGTTVHLGITREGVEEELVFPIVRDTIRIPALEWVLLENDVAYLQLFTFNLNIDEDFAQAVREIQSSGATKLIVDVRNNPGGLLDSAVHLAGWFLPTDSVVVYEDFGGGLSKALRASGHNQLGTMKTVFLINGGSASASEILAGAVHDLRDIPLVGEVTFGKGSVQQLEPFSNGGSLKVTVAKWLTPKGTSIAEAGIEPTVPIPFDLSQLQDGELEYGIPGKDPQLDKAIEIINTL
jgi:carboxyl-terminal processing protease